MESYAGAYLEAREQHACNKTHVNSSLTLACWLDQLLNSLVVLLKSKAAFLFVPNGIQDRPISCFKTLMQRTQCKDCMSYGWFMMSRSDNQAIPEA